MTAHSVSKIIFTDNKAWNAEGKTRAEPFIYMGNGTGLVKRTMYGKLHCDSVII